MNRTTNINFEKSTGSNFKPLQNARLAGHILKSWGQERERENEV